MGVYTAGYAYFKFSRALTQEEHDAWVERAKAAEYEGGDWHSDGGNVSDQFDINGHTWGDIGVVGTGLDYLDITAEGKVYDIRACLEAVFRLLPADVTVTGGGEFESDGEDWALEAIEGPERLVVECDTEAQADSKALDRIALLIREGAGIEAIADVVRDRRGPESVPDAEEHRTGRKLPDGSWEPAPYSDWQDANA